MSQGGGYIGTVDKHTVHVWSTEQSDWPSLKLHSTKALTVSHCHFLYLALCTEHRESILHQVPAPRSLPPDLSILWPMRCLAIAAGEECIAAGCTSGRMHLWSAVALPVADGSHRKSLLMQCLAIDAGEERIAAGDVSGRVHLWNAFAPAVSAPAGTASGSASDQPGQPGQAGRKKDNRDASLAKETLHWHAGPVTSLAFSADGTYLLSGGREAVLVSPCPRMCKVRKQNMARKILRKHTGSTA